MARASSVKPPVRQTARGTRTTGFGKKLAPKGLDLGRS
jgi:hypothetical protein